MTPDAIFAAVQGLPQFSGSTLVQGAGQKTLAAQAQDANIATTIADLIGKYSGGPATAFQQQAVLHGLNAAGLSNAVDAISGKYGLPTFGAPQAAPRLAACRPSSGRPTAVGLARPRPTPAAPGCYADGHSARTAAVLSWRSSG
jgi:hypothetical protein